MTIDDVMSQRSFISQYSKQSSTRVFINTPNGVKMAGLNSSVMSSGGGHRTVQKVNSQMMKSMLEKLTKKLQAFNT